jgi:hypothetical protein
MKKWFLLCLLNLVFCSVYADELDPIISGEKYSASLKRLDNVEKLENYVDSLCLEKGVKHFSQAEVEIANNVIEERFYHGYCNYSLTDNPVTFLAGKFIWDHMSAIVIPDDILKYPRAACSQQALVMMELLKNMGYNVRKLGLVGHFIMEVNYDDSWHIYDPNKETYYQGLSHDKIQQYFNNGTSTKVYAPGMTQAETIKMFSATYLGKTNEFPAKNIRLFHWLTKFGGEIALPLMILGAILWVIRKRKKSTAKVEKRMAFSYINK